MRERCEGDEGVNGGGGGRGKSEREPHQCHYKQRRTHLLTAHS